MLKRLKFAFSFALFMFALAFVAESRGLASFGMQEALGIVGSTTTMLGACVSVANIKDDACGANTGGVYELYVIHKNDIKTFPGFIAESTSELDGDIVLEAGKAWAKWDFAEDTGDINFKTEGDAGSQSVTQESNVYIPRINPLISNIINNALNGKYVIAVVDPNGQIMIGGSKVRPMKFEVDYKSGKKFNDKNGGDYKFTVGTSHTPLFYTGALPVVGAAVAAPAV